jgi:hypothetical protein
MTRTRAALAGSLLLAVIISACSGVARLSVLQPPSGADATAAQERFLLVPAPARQLGIGIDFYTYPGENIVGDARSTVAYAKSLHANAISISFPFFMHGERSSKVYADKATPAPGQIATVARIAEQAGLYVSIRPLLDTFSLGESRTVWKPAHAAVWFASYQKFVLPYALMAQQALIPEIVDGTELDRFAGSPRWTGLATALRGVYKGTLAYDNNWDASVAGSGGSGVTEAVDTYAPQHVPASARIGQLTAGWRAYDSELPRGTVESEVDIAAVKGAYLKPYDVLQWHAKRLMPSIQVNWFTAACNALAQSDLGGIYFWAVGLGQSLTTPPSLASPGSWVDSPGATAISACFARLGAR